MHLVTGGAGFIGSHIVKKLTADGADVKILDNLSTGTMANIEGLKVELVKGDVCDQGDVKNAVKDVDFVFHCAAMVPALHSIKDYLKATKINSAGTLNLLEASRKSNVKKFIYASSAAVYGNSPLLPREERMAPEPVSLYAVAKILGEYYCKVFSRIHALDTVSLRIFNVYGPMLNHESRSAGVVGSFINDMQENKRPVIFGDGNQTRDFVYVLDVAEAFVLASKINDACGDAINIATGKQTTILQLFEMINSTLKKKLKPKFSHPRPGDIGHSIADLSKAQKLFGCKPETTLKEGLRKTIEL